MKTVLLIILFISSEISGFSQQILDNFDRPNVVGVRQDMYSHVHEEYLIEGIKKMKIGHYQGAIKDFNSAIELKPDFLDAYNNRGISRKQLGDIQGAIEDFSRVIE